MPQHIIKSGECVSSLAERTGLPVEKIWNDPGNDKLRAAGRDPNVLQPGDEVSTPEVEPAKFERLEAGKVHVFRVTLPRAKFRVRLLDGGEPLASEPYVLTAGSDVHEGSSDGGGVVEAVIRARVTRATLELPERRQRYEVELGRLEPIDQWRGAMQRLRNLGWRAADVGQPTRPTQRVLRAFQAAVDLDPTGELDESTISKLREAYGC